MVGEWGGDGVPGEGWARGSEVLASWHACKNNCCFHNSRCCLNLARIGAALLQSLVLHLLEREVRVEKKEMVWMGVEVCTHVEKISAPTLADVHFHHQHVRVRIKRRGLGGFRIAEPLQKRFEI